MINAQEAYEKTCKVLDIIDISDDLAIIEGKINEGIERGALGVYSQPFEFSEISKAEKIALYLSEEFNYNASVNQGPRMQKGSDVIETVMININWKFIPSNIRESLNTRF